MCAPGGGWPSCASASGSSTSPPTSASSMSSPAASASPAIDPRSPVNEGGTVGPPLTDRRLRGYAEIGVASLILGTSASLIQISTMPASLLVVLRMALAGVVLGAIFLKTGGIAEVRRSGYLRRMILV